MRKIKYTASLFLATTLLIGCNETLEETYDNVTDGGKIRYVAKCSDIYATPGWERLVVEWKNGTDATIDKIKLTWTYDGKKDSTFLPSLTTSFVLNNLHNTVYRFDIVAIDKMGNKSLNETTYGRPYTREHEIMNAFTRGVVKSYFVKDKMIFFADRWNKNILEMKLQYKDTKGVTQYYEFTEDTYDNLITIDDVSMDPEDVVYVLRKGRFEDSVDEIEFDPYAISRLKNYSSGFINAIERRYGYSTNTKEQEIEFEKFLNEVEVLEFDYDIETFEDLLYCSNLKKVIFGKNRYTARYYTGDYRSVISGDLKKSKAIVEKTQELLGLKIETYGGKGTNDSHYFSPRIPGSVDMGVAKLPTDFEIIGKEAFVEFENGDLALCTPEDPYAELNNLFDDNNETTWEPTTTQKIRNYEMHMQLKETTQISGIKVSQPQFIPRNDKRIPFYMPRKIIIQTSTDGAVWQKVTYFESNVLGVSSGESTLLKFPEGKRDVRYIKILLQDRVDLNNNWTICVGDIVLFK